MSNELVGRPMEILLVEDGLVDARYTIAALARGNFKHRVTLVRDGQEALEFVRQAGRFARAPRPDLILLDLELPKKDGREVLAELKADYDLARIPVVILTSSDAEEDRLQGQLMHVEHYLTKPVDFDRFLAVVRDLKKHWQADVILPFLG